MRASMTFTRSRSGAANSPTTVISGAADRADDLAAEHVRRRQRREALDVVLADLLPVQDAAADLEHARLAGRVAQRLRDGDRVAVRLEERDRRRAVEQREQRLGARPPRPRAA